MTAELFTVEHPPVSPDGFAIEYACGCVAEWCEAGGLSGLFTTLACEQHAARHAEREASVRG